MSEFQIASPIVILVFQTKNIFFLIKKTAARTQDFRNNEEQMRIKRI